MQVGHTGECNEDFGYVENDEYTDLHNFKEVGKKLLDSVVKTFVHGSHVLAKAILNLANRSDIEIKVDWSVHYLGKHRAKEFPARLHLHERVQLGSDSQQYG